jgi:hypothetical protein
MSPYSFAWRPANSFCAAFPCACGRSSRTRIIEERPHQVSHQQFDSDPKFPSLPPQIPLLRCSATQKKNEPAFYKAIESVSPAVDSAVWRSRRKIRDLYGQHLG